MFVKNLLPLLPNHSIYVEVFGGGASLLFAKRKSKIEAYNDVDRGLVNFYRVIRDPKMFDRFSTLVNLTPYSKEEFDICKKTWKSTEDDVERAYRWFIVARMTFSGALGSSGGWSYSVKTSRFNCTTKAVASFLNIVDNLLEIHYRIRTVQIDSRDFRDEIKVYDSEDTLFYLDPPYIHDTRKSGGYEFEMTNEDHIDLVDIILKIKGKAILSGYNHDIYKPLLNSGWKQLDFETVAHSVRADGKNAKKNSQKRVESVWISPNSLEIKKIPTLWE